MAEGKKTTKKQAEKATENKQSQGEERSVNPWIPVAVVVAIAALIGIMALMSSNSATNVNTDQAATGTTQSGGSSSDTSNVDVSWITPNITPNEIVSNTGIPAKMFQQLYGVTEADMDKPLSSLGGKIADIAGVQDFVAQFVGGGGMGGGTGDTSGAPSGMGDTSGAPSGMGGTTTP